MITPTGGRPECFKLCAKFLAEQTYPGPIQWIVIDDCSPSTPKPAISPRIQYEYYVGPKQWRTGLNTQRLNLDYAFHKIRGKYVFFWEDDDYYAPTYIDVMLEHLRFARIVGEGNARYYNVNVPGFKRMLNHSHASLSQTAISADLLPILDLAINSGELYIDIVLWKKAHDGNWPLTVLSNSGLCVGMKGLPGRLGITPSHVSRDFMYDPQWAKLEEWIGKGPTLMYKNLGGLKNASSKG